MDLELLIKTYGPWGIVVFVVVVFLFAGGRWFKALFEGTLADARSERDEAKQLLRDMAASYERGSAERDRAMREGFAEVLREIRDNSGSHTTGRRAK